MYPATKTSILPQYINSAFITDRFLDSIHNVENPIPITYNFFGLKYVDSDELELDGLDYFYENKCRFEHEFEKECVKAIGKNNTFKYYDVISTIWYDGMNSRTGSRNYPLLSSIEKYFTVFKRIQRDSIFVNNQPDFGDTSVLFEPEIIDKILKLNNRLVTWGLEEWINHQYSDRFGTGDVYLRRGYVLNKEMDGETFFEQNYLSSYSLSISISEQFCQSRRGNYPTIINVLFGDCVDRIFFFSPFVKNTNKNLVIQKYEQLELCLIPPFTSHLYKQVDIRNSVIEYSVNIETKY